MNRLVIKHMCPNCERGGTIYCSGCIDGRNFKTDESSTFSKTIGIDMHSNIDKETAMLRAFGLGVRKGINDTFKRDLNSIYGNGDRKSVLKYMEEDIKNLEEALNRMKFKINNVIFNDPATIVFWADGTKTVVKCGKDDVYDPEKGLAMAIVKKLYGNVGHYYEEIKKWLPDEKPSNDRLSVEEYAERYVTNNKKKDLKNFTVDEYSSKYGVSKTTVYRMIKKGDLDAVKNDKGQWIISIK